MSKLKPGKVAIIGCGFVGSASAFALMQSGLFTEMVLLDANHQKAEGEAEDIVHGIPFGRPMQIYAGDYDDIADAAIIVITAGANQKPDETRLDLVNKNIAIFQSIIPEITKRDFEGILLIVANPVDILTYTAQKLSGYPENRVIGSGTVLDSARLKYHLGQHLGVDSRSVHAFIVGEHGDSEIAAWSSANISGIPLDNFCEMITEGEIMDAVNRPLGAKSLDGVKRRTRAGMGRCQAGFCSPRTMEIIARERGISQLDITKSGGKSKIVVGMSKNRG